MSDLKEEINVNRDWSLNVNLSGLNAPTGQKNLEVPEGYYKAKVTDMYVNPEKNPNRVVLKLTINEGPFSGTVRTDGMSIPKSEDDKVRYYWRGLAESAGYTPAMLDGGSIALGRDTFINRDVSIYFAPKEKSADGYERITYLAPAEWELQRRGFMAKQGMTPGGEGKGADVKPAVLGGVGGGSSSSNGTGGTTSKNDVLAKLGLGGGANA